MEKSKIESSLSLYLVVEKCNTNALPKKTSMGKQNQTRRRSEHTDRNVKLIQRFFSEPPQLI